MVAKGSIAKESSVKAAQEIRCYGIYFMAGVVTSQCLREKRVYARNLFVKRIYLREEMDTCRPYIGGAPAQKGRRTGNESVDQHEMS